MSDGWLQILASVALTTVCGAVGYGMRVLERHGKAIHAAAKQCDLQSIERAVNQKASKSDMAKIAETLDQHAREIRDTRSDIANIRGSLKLDQWDYTD